MDPSRWGRGTTPRGNSQITSAAGSAAGSAGGSAAGSAAGGGEPGAASGLWDGGDSIPVSRWRAVGDAGFDWAGLWQRLTDTTGVAAHAFAAGLLGLAAFLLLIAARPDIIKTKRGDGYVLPGIHWGKLGVIVIALSASVAGCSMWLNGIPTHW